MVRLELRLPIIVMRDYVGAIDDFGSAACFDVRPNLRNASIVD